MRPSSRARSRTATPSTPCAENRRSAASRIASRVGSGGTAARSPTPPGPCCPGAHRVAISTEMNVRSSSRSPATAPSAAAASRRRPGSPRAPRPSASESTNIGRSSGGSWRFRSRFSAVRARGPVWRIQPIVSATAASSWSCGTTRDDESHGERLGGREGLRREEQPLGARDADAAREPRAEVAVGDAAQQLGDAKGRAVGDDRRGRSSASSPARRPGTCR